MTKRCELNYVPADPPALCIETCGDLWAAAPEVYTQISNACGDEPECTHDLFTDAPSIRVDYQDPRMRRFSMFALCNETEADIAERSQTFTCPRAR